jgi:hypothetical protein
VQDQTLELTDSAVIDYRGDTTDTRDGKPAEDLQGAEDGQARFRRVADDVEFSPLIKSNWEVEMEVNTSDPVVQAALKLPFQYPT